jgi:cytochrome c556
MPRLFSAIALSAALLLPVAAQAGPNDEIKYRKLVIGSAGNMAVSINAALKGELDQQRNVPAMARAMAANAALAREAFRVNTAGQGNERTTVKGDLIWANWADFSKRMDEFARATANASQVAQRGDAKATGEAMRAVFGTCKGCHDTYRQ